MANLANATSSLSGHECRDCKFVPDAGAILTYFVPRDVREKANSKPRFVGTFTMSRWSGHSGFYLFRCQGCDNICVDYPHGYRENGCIYIRCGQCSFEIILRPGKYSDIYQRERVVPPPSFFGRLVGLIKFRIAMRRSRKKQLETLQDVEAKGIRVLKP